MTSEILGEVALKKYLAFFSQASVLFVLVVAYCEGLQFSFSLYLQEGVNKTRLNHGLTGVKEHKGIFR